jgi:hypothetical protein
MLNRFAVWPALLLVLLALLGCEALVHPDSGALGTAPVVCTPGASVISPCIGGGTCTQVCNTGGSFDPCVCGPVPGGAGAGGH